MLGDICYKCTAYTEKIKSIKVSENMFTMMNHQSQHFIFPPSSFSPS